MTKRFIIIIFILLLTLQTTPAKAQDAATGPIYIVQSGDTLYSIAYQFGVSPNDLVKANNIADPNNLWVGMQLTIPGMEGVTGNLVTEPIPLGESLRSLTLRHQVPVSLLSRLNHVTSPSEIYAGANLIIPQKENQAAFQPNTAVRDGQSLLEVAVLTRGNPWTVQQINQINGSWDVLPGETVYSPAAADQPQVNSISPLISQVDVSPMPLMQGHTTEITITTTQPLDLSGQLTGRDLHFFQVANNKYVALQGIYRMQSVGLTPISLQGKTADGQEFAFEQPVLLVSLPRIEDPRLTVDPITTDPTIAAPENKLVNGIISQITPDKLWKDWVTPIDVPKGYTLVPDCTTDRFGNLRAYNDGPFDFFHTGLDLSACGNNLNIYASADGVVVYADFLTIRGGYTIIDHGWGIYSAYGHQSEIKVKVGDHVTAGQLIGLIGKTGRVTGPHLHWEIWVNGAQIEPTDWLNKQYP